MGNMAFIAIQVAALGAALGVVAAAIWYYPLIFAALAALAILRALSIATRG